MALNDSNTKANIVALVEVAFVEKFPEDNPPTSSEEIATAMGEVIAEVVGPMFDALRDDSVVTVPNITPGINTAVGTIE